MKIFRNFRDYVGLTQEQLANALSIDRHTVACYETDRATPSFKVLIQSISVFNITLDFLLENDSCLYPKNLKLLKLSGKCDQTLTDEEKRGVMAAAKPLINNAAKNAVTLKKDTVQIKLKNNFNRNLKELRSAKGLSQPELADKIGVSRSLIAQYETSTYPSIERLTELCGVLDISAHALATGEKLVFDFQDQDFGQMMLLADHYLSLEDHKFLIRLMEAILKK